MATRPDSRFEHRTSDFDYWREVISARFLPLLPERCGRRQFEGTLAQSALGDLPLTSISVQGQRVMQPEYQPAGEAAIFFNLQASGDMVYVQNGTRSSNAGSGFVIDSASPFELNCPTRMTHVNVIFSRTTLLDALRRDVTVAGAQLLPARREDRLCLDYLTFSVRGSKHIPDEPALAAARFRKLFTFAINSRYGSEPFPRLAAAAVAYGRACSMIAAQSHDPALSPARLAHAISMSLRTLERVFQRYGEPPAVKILQARVELAKSILSNFEQRHQSITDIAHRSGFSDSAYFSRTFKRLVGMTPRQFRNHG